MVIHGRSFGLRYPHHRVFGPYQKTTRPRRPVLWRHLQQQRESQYVGQQGWRLGLSRLRGFLSGRGKWAFCETARQRLMQSVAA